MDFDEYEYLEKTVENPELQRKEKTNGSDGTVKADEKRDHRRSSKHKASEKHDDVDRHSKKLKSGDDSHGYDNHKERGSSQHRSPSRDGDKEKDRHRSIHDNRDRMRDQDRDKEEKYSRVRDKHREREHDRERNQRDRGSESERERERDNSRRSRSMSERLWSDLDERDRDRSRDRDYRDRERTRDNDYRERERGRESRERDKDSRYGRAIFRWSFWQLGQAQNLRSWVSKFLPSGVYLKACIAGLGGFGFFVTAMILSCYLFSSTLSSIALLHLFCCRTSVRE